MRSHGVGGVSLGGCVSEHIVVSDTERNSNRWEDSPLRK